MMVDGQRRRPGRRRIVAAVLLALFVVAFAILWAERAPIVRHYVDRELARRGVRAQYAITRLGPAIQRLDTLVIGNPAAPDLTADWAELHLGWGLRGPFVETIRASGVRLNGRLVAGRLSLGEIDRLLPKPSGAPFTLPDLAVDLHDARLRLATPAGQIALSIEGKGHLRGGFDGTLAAVAPGLAVAGCRVAGVNAFLALSVRDREPIVEGPVRAASVACPDRALAVDALWVSVKARLGETLTTWRGATGFALGAARYQGNRVAEIRGKADFAGTADETQGHLDFQTGAARFAPAAAEHVGFDGRYGASGGGVFGLRGDLSLVGAALAPATVAGVRGALGAAAGSPVGPLGVALAGAVERAARRADAKATLDLQQRPEGGRLTVTGFDLTSASGARARLDNGGVDYLWGRGAGTRVHGNATLGGGGFPDVRLALEQPQAGAPITGEAVIAPYAAGSARLVTTPIRFTAASDGSTRFATLVTLDGPLGDGRVAGLSLPLAGRFGPGDAFALGEGCVPLRFTTLAVAGMRLGSTHLPLCPVDGHALLARSAGGALRGGVRVVAPKLIGRVGEAPLSLAARTLGVTVGRPGFTAEGVAVRLGEGTSLDIVRLSGEVGKSGLAGKFEGTAGQIANVPLNLSGAEGTWQLSNGALGLNGRLAVDDSAAPPRFHTLVSNDVALALKNGTIRATGTLVEPKSRRRVADVTLVHALGSGQGGATLTVPGLTFGDALQPEALTPLTLGIVANVVGTVKGAGRIDWSSEGVTSGGDFETDALDLAAAFGPVSRLSGHIHFSDLLGLATPSGQEVRLGEVNPGIAVQDGVVRYQLLPGQKMRIESGRWPFSGGALILAPTELDFGQPVERRLTFQVDGLDAALFIEQFKLDNVAATGRFDGVLPMIFDQEGGRIVGGRLVVRQGGGTLAYVGEVSNASLGMFGKLAFDALKAIRYDSLAIELDGALDGEIVSRIVFTGVNDKPADGAPSTGLLKDLTGLPFKFNIVVRAPFRGLLHTATTFADPTALIREQEQAIQPQESGDVKEKP